MATTSKVGMSVTYTPTKEEQPMAPEEPQAAIITAWDLETEKASLAVFPAGQAYFLAKVGAAEGTIPGTFQQPESTGGSASAASSSPSAEAAGTKSHSGPNQGSHKEKQY